MLNPTLLFMNPGSVVYTGSGAGFSNLNDYDTVATWSAGSTTFGTYLDVDLGVSTNVTHVLLGNQNIVAIRGANPTISGSNVADFSSKTILHPGIIYFVQADPCIIPLTATGSFRYIRLKFDAVGAFFAVPILGAFWAGNGLVMDSPFDVPFKIENAEYQTFEGVSLNGNLRSTQIYSGGRIRNEIAFSVQSDLTANLIRAFVQTVKGKRYPFYFAVDPSATTSARLMHFSDDYVPVETVGYNLNRVAMGMRTHISGY